MPWPKPNLRDATRADIVRAFVALQSRVSKPSWRRAGAQRQIAHAELPSALLATVRKTTPRERSGRRTTGRDLSTDCHCRILTRLQSFIVQQGQTPDDHEPPPSPSFTS